MADEVVRFFNAHMQKTAGTSLRDRFRNEFPAEAIYPNRDDGPDILRAVISVEQFLQSWEQRGDEIRLVAAHLPLRVLELIDAPFVTFAVLRPPIERTLSYLRHQKKVVKADRDKPLEEIYDDPFRFTRIIKNHMARTLAVSPEEFLPDEGVMVEVPYDDAFLERAKTALAGLDLFALQPYFEDFCTELSARYNINLGEPIRTNTTEPEDAPPHLVERIIEDNALDIALYDYAVELYEERRKDWIT